MASAVGKSTGNPGARPEFRNIHISQIVRYRMPLAALVSILHRISGAAMFLIGLPLVLYLFQQSVVSELSFERYREFVANPFVKLVLVGIIWAYLHHLLAGVRHLANADSAQAELAEHGVRTSALLAAGVRAHRELRLLVGLVDQCLLSHGLSSP